MNESMNVGRLMRGSTTMRVGKSAVEEMIHYIEDMITGYIMPNAEDNARKEKRKTILEKDIIRAKDRKRE